VKLDPEPPNLTPRTQNPEPRTQNPEPRTQNPEPRTQKLENRNLTPETRIPKPETRNHEPHQDDCSREGERVALMQFLAADLQTMSETLLQVPRLLPFFLLYPQTRLLPRESPSNVRWLLRTCLTEKEAEEKPKV